MNKTVFPALLVATIMVAGAFAFMPVEQASTVHLSGTTVSGSIDASGTSDVDIATNTGNANAIKIGVTADPDTIALNGDTTIVGDTTIGSVTADTFDWATAGGDAFNIGTDNTNADDINIGSILDTVDLVGVTINIGATNAVSTTNVGTGTAIDTINIGTGGTGIDLITIGSAVSEIGFYGTTPAPQSAQYTFTNEDAVLRVLEQATPDLNITTDVLTTLINDLKLTGIID